MSTSKLVYHFTDSRLFSTFLATLPRAALLEPLRNDDLLRNRYFKGYRLTDKFPDRSALERLFEKEILVHENHSLITPLCVHWLEAHRDLFDAALHNLAVPPGNPRDHDQWLRAVHVALANGGHIETAATLAAALAKQHAADDIAILVSELR
jgi:hypothetical protein